jgi:nucleotide-binding universal stress UspA family protein
VPLDFSDSSLQALDYAVMLAQKLLARLTLLHVAQVPVMAGGIGGAGADAALVAYMEQTTSDMHQIMDVHAQRVRESGLDCTAKVVHGAPYQQIIDTASANRMDMIVMGTHGHTGLQRLLLGSVAERVVRLASCPVLVIRQVEPINGNAGSDV